MTQVAEREILYGPERPSNAISFEVYRNFCDILSGDNFRKTGIQNPEGYEVALTDERTVFVDVGDKKIPLLTPIQYAGGYDEERCRELTGSDTVYLLSVPSEFLEGIDLSSLNVPETNYSILIESKHDVTDELKEFVPDQLKIVADMEVHDFVNLDLPEESRNASMSIFSLNVGVVEKRGHIKPSQGISFEEAYRRELELPENEQIKSTKLFTSEELQAQPELLDKLWGLYRERFDWLGQNHPVTMEESKAFFDSQILDEKTFSIIRFDDDGEPACLGGFMLDISQCSWLAPGFVQGVVKEAEQYDEEVIYFPEIVSSSTGGRHYSKDVMQLLCRLVAARGGENRVIFESTNLSSLYIPRMVSIYVKTSGEKGITMLGEGVEKLDQLDYWFVKPKPD